MYATFIIVLALIWMLFAVVQDLKKREIADWVNFSLIIFALGIRFFYDLFNLESFSILFNLPNINSFSFIFDSLKLGGVTKELLIFIGSFLNNLPLFKQGLIGLVIFFALGNLFYYSRFFAGGDAKLMIALGTILPFYNGFFENIKIFILFFIFFFSSGAVYGLARSVFCIKNFKEFKKEFLNKLKERKKIYYSMLILGLILAVLGLFERTLFFFGVLFFIFPYLYAYLKAVDEKFMIKKISVKNLTEGDWLYRDVKTGKKLVKAKWDGVSREEIREIQKKHREVLIREGIPFSPVFLISFLVLVFYLGYGILFGREIFPSIFSIFG